MEDDNNSTEQPLLSSSSSAFAALSGDISAIDSVGSFFREFCRESKKLCYLAGPAIFISLCRYSLRAVTVIFAGHVGTLALAAIAVQNSVISAFTWGILLGMGSALETLCGQAYGAGQLDMIGIYLQRSWIVLTATAVFMSPLYLFAGRLLAAIGQAEEMSEAAGTLARWLLPHLFAVAMNFPMAKFILAQSKVMVMAAIAAAATALNALLSWLLMLRLGWGLAGAAVALNVSWRFMVVAQLVNIFSGTCGRAWSGFSWLAFHNLSGFLKLSLASAVMLWVAIGAGWQAVVADVNISCCYLFGVLLGLVLGYNLKMGVTGIWFGMLTGTLVQTFVLLVMVYRTNWRKEASMAGDRIRKWGGKAASNKNDIET